MSHRRFLSIQHVTFPVIQRPLVSPSNPITPTNANKQACKPMNKYSSGAFQMELFTPRSTYAISCWWRRFRHLTNEAFSLPLAAKMCTNKNKTPTRRRILFNDTLKMYAVPHTPLRLITPEILFFIASASPRGSLHTGGRGGTLQHQQIQMESRQVRLVGTAGSSDASVCQVTG